MTIHHWTTFGYAYGRVTSDGLTATPSIVACTIDATNSRRSSIMPNDAYVSNIEVNLTSCATSGGGLPRTVTLYLARDSGGLMAVTPGNTDGSTQDIDFHHSTTTTGNVVFQVDTDYHIDSSVSNFTEGTLYAVIQTDRGTANCEIRVNWRA